MRLTTFRCGTAMSKPSQASTPVHVLFTCRRQPAVGSVWPSGGDSIIKAQDCWALRGTQEKGGILMREKGGFLLLCVERFCNTQQIYNIHSK